LAEAKSLLPLNANSIEDHYPIKMDLFDSVVTASGLIIQFLTACSSFSDDAKSLKARFDWDMRAIRAIQEHFKHRGAQGSNAHLSIQDQELLNQTSNYLDNLAESVKRSLRKIERTGFWRAGFNRAMWISRQSELQSLEKELFDWTRRFDVRFLGLPPELQTIIPATTTNQKDEDPTPSAIVASNRRLGQFLAQVPAPKRMRAKDILLEDSNALAAAISGRADRIASLPLRFGQEQLIFAYRKHFYKMVPGTPEFREISADMGELAAALNCIDPAADIKLLKVEYYFYHPDTQAFLFAHHLPYPIMSMTSLSRMIDNNPFPMVPVPLDGRIRIAHKLAEALFFLHTANFLHKNITSSSVVALRREMGMSNFEFSEDPTSSLPVDECYLMGFDLIRSNDARTIGEGAGAKQDQTEKTPRSIWDFDVYQHPHRLREKNRPRYIKTYDVYSLGVVLLEIGLWEPLVNIQGNFDEKTPNHWPKELIKAARETEMRMGQRYRFLVQWCLGLTGDEIIRPSEFVEKVLDPLEDMEKAIALS